jgi:hypothetical protein
METQSSFLGRIAEKTLGWIVLGLIVAAGIAIWRMDSTLRGDIWSFAWRSAVWVVLAAAIPWLARFIMKAVALAGTNWAPLALLAGLVALDLVAAAAVMTGWPTGGWGWSAGLAALGLAATYNYWVTEYLAERAGV